MKLEEYISKRKREDGINEFELEKRMENTRTCVNYVFEYFNNYLETIPADEHTVLHDQKLEKYRKTLSQYNPATQDWLLALYSSHGKYMHKQLSNFITDPNFLLYDTDAEFRALSYDVYAKAIRRFPFLDGQAEMVFQFIKEYHRVKSTFPPYHSDFYISDDINEWIYDTYNKHGVNIYNFCFTWTQLFYSDTNLWPKGHKQKSEYYADRMEYKGINLDSSLFWNYDYKQKSNLFALDNLYRGMPKKSFVRGRKQEFEAVLMYCWLHSVTNDDEYWDTYYHTVLV